MAKPIVDNDHRSPEFSSFHSSSFDCYNNCEYNVSTHNRRLPLWYDGLRRRRPPRLLDRMDTPRLEKKTTVTNTVAVNLAIITRNTSTSTIMPLRRIYDKLKVMLITMIVFCATITSCQTLYSVIETPGNRPSSLPSSSSSFSSSVGQQMEQQQQKSFQMRMYASNDNGDRVGVANTVPSLVHHHHINQRSSPHVHWKPHTNHVQKRKRSKWSSSRSSINSNSDNSNNTSSILIRWQSSTIRPKCYPTQHDHQHHHHHVNDDNAWARQRRSSSSNVELEPSPSLTSSPPLFVPFLPTPPPQPPPPLSSSSPPKSQQQQSSSFSPLSPFFPMLSSSILSAQMKPPYVGSTATTSANRMETYQQHQHLQQQQQPQQQTSPTKNITAQVGHPVYLHCVVESLGDKMVSWIRLRDFHLLTIGSLTFSSDDRFVVRPASHSINDWSLQIKHVTLKDEGLYECQINSDPPRSQYYYLHVVVPVSEIAGNPDIFVRSGAPINLTCLISSSPEPPAFVFWYHNNRMINYDYNQEGKGQISVQKDPLKNDVVISRLLIKKARLDDSGNYTCSPSNAEPASSYVHVLQGEKRMSNQIQNDWTQTDHQLNNEGHHSSSSSTFQYSTFIVQMFAVCCLVIITT